MRFKNRRRAPRACSASRKQRVTHDQELAARAQRNVHIIDGQVSDLLRETAASLAAVVGQATGTPAGNNADTNA